MLSKRYHELVRLSSPVHRYEEVTGFREAAAKKYSEKHFVSIGELPIGIRRHIERLF
jgi:hypothetical protein